MLTRAKAINLARKYFARHFGGNGADDFIYFLEEVGILKLEEEKTPYYIIRDVVGIDLRDTAQIVLDNLTVHGYDVIKEKK